MISAVVLTNNSMQIEKTLLSLLWCDEIIVIDDYSSDLTLDIVKKYTDKIYQRRLHNDFAAQRNFGLTKAKGPWVLYVDSDEIVSENLKKEILDTIENSLFDTRTSEINGYYLSRLDFMWGREITHGETGDIRLLRLGKIGTGKWERPVHETWHINGKIGSLRSPLYHYPHPDVAQFLSKINRYTTINAKYFFDEGKRVSFWQIGAYPIAKFIRNYFIKLGFLDGTVGIIMALMMSLHSFLTRGKMWELERSLGVNNK